MTGLESLFEACLKEAERDALNKPAVSIELGLIITPEMIEAHHRENSRRGRIQKVTYEFWRAGFERSFHGVPNVVELGEITETFGGSN